MQHSAVVVVFDADVSVFWMFVQMQDYREGELACLSNGQTLAVLAAGAVATARHRRFFVFVARCSVTQRLLGEIRRAEIMELQQPSLQLQVPQEGFHCNFQAHRSSFHGNKLLVPREAAIDFA